MRRPPFSTLYTVRTRGAQTITDFVPVPGAVTERDMWATIQPLDARALADLDPGLRTRARYACFTYEDLVPAETGGPPPDLVVVRGVEYEVHGGYDDGAFTGAPFAGREYVLAAPEVK